MKARELTPEDLQAMGFKEQSPAERAASAVEYEAQIDAIAARIRESAEAKIAAGWATDNAFDAAVHAAADSDKTTEATIKQMTLAASALARGWTHSEAFVLWWNALFPTADRVQGFACPATIDMPDGRRVGVIASWSGYLSTTQRTNA